MPNCAPAGGPAGGDSSWNCRYGHLDGGDGGPGGGGDGGGEGGGGGAGGGGAAGEPPPAVRQQGAHRPGRPLPHLAPLHPGAGAGAGLLERVVVSQNGFGSLANCDLG